MQPPLSNPPPLEHPTGKVWRFLILGLCWAAITGYAVYFHTFDALVWSAYAGMLSMAVLLGVSRSLFLWAALSLVAWGLATWMGAPTAGTPHSLTDAVRTAFAGAFLFLDAFLLFIIHRRTQQRLTEVAARIHSLESALEEGQKTLQVREDLLTRAENRLKAIFENAPDGIFLVSEDGSIYDVNPAGAAIFGYRVDELLARPLNILLPPHLIDKHTALHRAFMDASRLRSMNVARNLVGRDKDGREIPLSIGLSGLEIGGRRVAVAYVQDASERVQVMQALQEERDLLNNIAAASAAATLVVSEHRTSIFSNQAARQLFQLPDDDESVPLPPESRFWHLAHPDGTLLQLQEHPFYLALHTQKPILNREYLLPGDGQPECILIVNAIPISKIHREHRGVILSILDVTAQKETEQNLRRLESELRESVTRFRLLAENTTDLIAKISPHGIFLYVSPASLPLLGYQPDELLGKSIYDLAHPDDVVQMVQAAHQGQRGGRSYTFSHRMRHKNGTYIWIETTNKSILDPDTQVVNEIVTVSRDFSQHKAAEDALTRARNIAEATNRAKSEFLANMSHEIRTPLNAVIGMTSLLLETDLSLEQQDYIETIRTSGDALLSVINDILDFSKIEAGKMELECQPFDLRECIESAQELVARPAYEKNLELAYIIGENVPNIVVGDVTRIHQILVNLLSNAVKFTTQGDILIQVHSHPQPDNRHEITFSVRDTGIGIPPERQPYIFDAFSQADASTTRKFGGTGLGLTICKRLVDMMGGKIWVESVPGRGSTFAFCLRMEAGSPHKAQHKRGTQPLLTGKRILILDSNPISRDVIRQQVTAWGMLVLAANQEKEALNIIRSEEQIDLVLMDAEFSNAKDSRVQSSLQFIEEHLPAEIPLILLKRVGERNIHPRSTRPIVHLSKPIKSLQLYNALVSTIDRSRRPITQPVKEVFSPEMGAQHPLRILIAEDHLINQKVILGVLEKLGYRADVAANGIEVTEALERQLYDVILMDVQMPEMDGVQATRYIRENLPARRQPTIIALTAHALPGDRERYLEMGMDDYISKPVQVQHLKDALRHCKPIAERGTRPLRPFVRKTPSLEINIPTEEEPASSSAIVLPPPSESETHPKWQYVQIDTLANLQVILGGTKQALVELVEIFLDETPQKFARLEELIASTQYESAQRIAHSVKGLSATFGSPILAEKFKALEAACEQKEHVAALELIREGRACFDIVARELSAWCSDGAASAAGSGTR
ncbi:MAG: hypothetical protein Fur0018_21350 [Anaerolineales bacterium]